MNPPLVSVLMPAYNSEEFIGLAIESILNQTFTDFELIIIDDHSVDKTWEIIKEYKKQDRRIIALRNENNLKICRTLNRGLDIAKGQLIARMDADDWSYPERLEKQVALMEKDKAVVVSGAGIAVCDEKLQIGSYRMYHESDNEIRQHLFRYSPFCHPVIMMRTEAVKNVSGYSVFLYDAEDYDLYFRLGLAGKFANLPDCLLKYRINSNSVSVKRARRQEKITLFIRLKAVYEYSYRMTSADGIYFAGQLLSHYVIPPKAKIWLFNKIRNKNRSEYKK